MTDPPVAHPLEQLVRKWRSEGDLAVKHPPFSYEQGVCVGRDMSADELEAFLAWEKSDAAD